MTLYKYEIFNTTVKLGSVTKASETLRITQSGVSHAISSLESELGFTLFTRVRSGIQLTKEGEKILPSIRNVLAQNEIVKQQSASIKGVEIGTITIGTFSSVSMQWLPEIIKRFKVLHPAIQINLLEGTYEVISPWIGNGIIDFGFISEFAAKPFDFIPLKKDRIVCVLPHNHKLQARKIISFTEIQDEIFIMPKWGKNDDLKHCLFENITSPNIEYEAAEPSTVVSMVQHGLGISILPEMVLHSHRHNEQIRIISLDKSYHRLIGLASLSFKKASPAAMAFITCVKSWLMENNLYDFKLKDEIETPS